MKRLFYICVCLLIAASCHAKTWYKGSIVLDDQQVLAGELSVESRYDAVLFRSNGKISVYPAHKVMVVRFYDEASDVNRKFVSLENSSLMIHHYQLYEVVVAGEVSLLRVEETNIAATKEEHEALGYRYVVHYKGDLVSLKQFRTKIYPRIKDLPGIELGTYVRMNNLNPNSEANAIRIIQYFNEAVVSSHEFASN